jgi:hypothetical protein
MFFHVHVSCLLFYEKNFSNETITFKDFGFNQLTLPLSTLLSEDYKELSSILADQIEPSYEPKCGESGGVAESSY